MDPEQLLITVAQAQTEGHGRHVAVRGELDVDTSPRLLGEIHRLMAEGATLIVLDLTGASFIDSSGLRVLVHGGEALKASGGDLLIEGMSPAVEKLLELTGMLERRPDWSSERRDREA